MTTFTFKYFEKGQQEIIQVNSNSVMFNLSWVQS